MYKKSVLHIVWVLVAVVLFTACRQHDVDVRRAHVDGLNKQGFVYRYKAPEKAVDYASMALAYLDDSLPNYSDGRLRAWNNMAFAQYMLSNLDEAQHYIDSVYSFEGSTPNAEIEKAIAQLLDARLMQRACRIADSYQVLYDIDKQGQLRHNKGNYLYSYAQLEYFITSLTLNYNYRHGMESSLVEQLADIETYKGTLPCDYAEDMAMNYALAYGYSQLCGPNDTLGENLQHSLEYCLENFNILASPGHDCPYQFANTLQMLAFLGEDTTIPAASWQRQQPLVDSLCSLLHEVWGLDFCSAEDPVLAMHEEATRLFFAIQDPYQQLGACVATARYCLSVADTVSSRYYFSLPLLDTLMDYAYAPKFESLLYHGLLTSRIEASADDYMEWYLRELEIRDYIAQNEKADFLLRTKLSQSQTANHTYLAFTITLAALFLALVVAVVMLRRNQYALQRETIELHKAKQQDVERIANVETCLSVLRHDVTPFVNYLQNKNLSSELRNEVLDQLIRTFSNIKNWTNLSIPTGLQFRGEHFPLQEVFDSVHQELGTVICRPTTLQVQADRLLLHILLRNLVQNALQHAAGSEVVLAAQEEEGFAHVTVTDNGCGMDEQQVESLFRSDKLQNGSDGHSGFGLILCRYIIKKHDDATRRGCSIWAESRPGGGTTMHFRIALSNAQNSVR